MAEIEPLTSTWKGSRIALRLIKAHQDNDLREWKRILHALRQYEPKNLNYIFRRKDWGILSGEGGLMGVLSDYGGLPIHLAASGDPTFLSEILNFVNEKYTERERLELVNTPIPRGPGANLTPLEIAVLAAKGEPRYRHNIELLRDYGAETELKEGQKVKKFQPDRANPRSHFNSIAHWLNNKRTKSTMDPKVRTMLLKSIKEPTLRMIATMKQEMKIEEEEEDLIKSLHAAILAKNEEEIIRITNEIAEGADVDIDAVSSDGTTALAHAMTGDDHDIVIALLDAGANPNAGRWDGEPMHLADANDFP